MFHFDCSTYITTFYQSQLQDKASKTRESDSSKFSYDKYLTIEKPGWAVAFGVSKKISMPLVLGVIEQAVNRSSRLARRFLGDTNIALLPGAEL